jgi:hypothetical protein
MNNGVQSLWWMESILRETETKKNQLDNDNVIFTFLALLEKNHFSHIPEYLDIKASNEDNIISYSLSWENVAIVFHHTRRRHEGKLFLISVLSVLDCEKFHFHSLEEVLLHLLEKEKYYFSESEKCFFIE